MAILSRLSGIGSDPLGEPAAVDGGASGVELEFFPENARPLGEAFQQGATILCQVAIATSGKRRMNGRHDTYEPT